MDTNKSMDWICEFTIIYISDLPSVSYTYISESTNTLSTIFPTANPDIHPSSLTTT